MKLNNNDFGFVVNEGGSAGNIDQNVKTLPIMRKESTTGVVNVADLISATYYYSPVLTVKFIAITPEGQEVTLIRTNLSIRMVYVSSWSTTQCIVELNDVRHTFKGLNTETPSMVSTLYRLGCSSINSAYPNYMPKYTNSAVNKAYADSLLVGEESEDVYEIPLEDALNARRGYITLPIDVDVDMVVSNDWTYVAEHNGQLYPISYDNNFNQYGCTIDNVSNGNGSNYSIGFVIELATNRLIFFNSGLDIVKNYDIKTPIKLKKKKHLNIDKLITTNNISFNESGELVVTINGVTKTFVPKN